MRILILAGTYPHSGHFFSGAFNEKCVIAIAQLCQHVEVLAPRPYVPPGLGYFRRWKSYAAIKNYEIRNGVAIHRPATPVIPEIGSATWTDLAPFLCSLATARKLHRRVKFDAILSFDIVQAGGIAWRLGKYLGIPAAGWAFGTDMRHPKASPKAAVAIRAIRNLSLIFYQSHELFERAADLLGIAQDKMFGKRHIVLPHGIPEPPTIAVPDVRHRLRQELGIKDNAILLTYTGRILRQKGVFELVDAVRLAATRDPRINCIMVGSHPEYDETNLLQDKVNSSPLTRQHVRIVPACTPAKIWDYLSAADIFVFPSHNEGMPNSLLEAMAIGVPAVCFGIPAVSEIDSVGETLVAVPPLDVIQFSEAIIQLAKSPEHRAQIGAAAKRRIQERYLVKNNMAEALHLLSQVIPERISATRSKPLATANHKGIS